MFKIFVDNKEKERRRSLCLACEYYKADTRTCGTFRAVNPLGDKVVYNGQEFTLCGCVMPVKWQFSSASCSVGKWERQITAEAMEELKAIVKDYKGKPSILNEDMKRIVNAYNMATSKKQKYTNCGKCIKDMLNELIKLVDNE
jgi:hypothetical protein